MKMAQSTNQDMPNKNANQAQGALTKQLQCHPRSNFKGSRRLTTASAGVKAGLSSAKLDSPSHVPFQMDLKAYLLTENQKKEPWFSLNGLLMGV